MTPEHEPIAPPPGCPAHAGSTPAGRVPLYAEEFAADPVRSYAEMRARGAVVPVELAPGLPASLVVAYDAALEVLRDPSTFPRDPRRWQRHMPPDHPILQLMGYRPTVSLVDGKDHARYRTVIADSMARVDTEDLRACVERSADALVGRFAAMGEADLRADYALPLPLMVCSEILGIPVRIREIVVTSVSNTFDRNGTEDAGALVYGAVGELLALKRSSPGADVTSWMLEHPIRLNDEELMNQIIMLMLGCAEMEQNLIANTLRLLLSDDRFGGDLAGGSLPVVDALDEVLWSDPPLANTSISYPVRDTDFRGTLLPADQPVLVSLAAANTDPSTASAHRVGNRAHLAWGAGPHGCPVQGQARLIATVAIEKLLDALPDMELAVPADELLWRPGFIHRALASLPVRFPPVSTMLPVAEPAPGTVPETASGAAAGWAAGPAEPVREPEQAEAVPSETVPSETVPSETVPSETVSTAPAAGALARWRSLATKWWTGG